jgi:hypothetical protein
MRHERQAINYTIQGCAADILKVVLSEAHRRKLFVNADAYLICPAYDEIATSVPMEAAFDYCCLLKEIMNLTPPNHLVPMVAEFSVSADSWGRMEEIGQEFTKDQIDVALEKSLHLSDKGKEEDFSETMENLDTDLEGLS